MPIQPCKTKHILIGLGGTGGKILRAFKMRMFEEFRDPNDRNENSVKLLYVDSTREMMPENGKPRPDFDVFGQDASFTNDEFLNIKNNLNITQVLRNINLYPNIRAIVDDADAVSNAIGNLGAAAGQMRRAGRLLFASNVGAYRTALQNATGYCNARATGNNPNLYIWIFAGLSGGTGSGSIIDAIVQARDLYPNAKIAVYAMLPEMDLPNPTMDTGLYYPNGYAALRELNALQEGKYNPHNVYTGQIANVYDQERHGVADGITIYCNVNEGGNFLGALEALPQMVSDIVFTRIFLTPSHMDNDDIIHAFSYENINQAEDELSEIDIREGGVRTRKINSFGIKRVYYDELRVLSHITYTIGDKILSQFIYNHWSDEFGYVDQEPQVDYNNTYLNPAKYSQWMLDRSYLTYDIKILPQDPEYPFIKTFWHNLANDYVEDDNVRNSDNPLSSLENNMEDNYNADFRGGLGVINYYKNKSLHIDNYATYISNNIERDLFQDFRNGVISIRGLQIVCQGLIEYVDNLKNDFEYQLTDYQNYFNDVMGNVQSNVEEWSKLFRWNLISFIRRICGEDKKLFSNHQTLLEYLFEAKTMIQALPFAISLLVRIKANLEQMKQHVTRLNANISNCRDEDNGRIMRLTQVNNNGGHREEVRDDDPMLNFENLLMRDRNVMSSLANILRQQIIPNGQAAIDFGKVMGDNPVGFMMNKFDVILSENIRDIHDGYLAQLKIGQRVLGRNILDVLHQIYRDDNSVTQYAYRIVGESLVYLPLNQNQQNMIVPNNEDIHPNQINRKIIQVNIPEVGNEEFVEQLSYGITNAVGHEAAMDPVHISRHNPLENEITIITFRYSFPMRFADWLGIYKMRYENSMNTRNNAINRKNAILLHTEGDGSMLPSLFVRNANNDN